MAFPTFILYVSFVVAFVLLATMAAARTTTTSFYAAGVTNATAVTSATVKARSGDCSSAASTAPANTDQYICYLCRERNTLMIKWCPLDKDDCHIACLSSSSSSSRRTLAPGPVDEGDRNALGAGPDDDGGRNGDDCYVMKLYPDGSWVIVDVVSCQAVAGCYLVCSYGDVARRDGDGESNTTPAVARAPLSPRVADFERCGDQFMAPGPAVLGAGV